MQHKEFHSYWGFFNEDKKGWGLGGGGVRG